MTDPKAMRTGMARYVRAVHEAYVAQAKLLPPAARGAMPLLRSGLRVAAAGARRLHVIATAESFGPISDGEVEVREQIDLLSWTLRFYDPVVLPPLGLIDDTSDDGSAQVRAALGISTHFYHLMVLPGASLEEHQAVHAGTGLANSHAKRFRQFEAIRQHAGGRESLVDEMTGASVAGLDRAHALLAQQLAPGDPEVAALAMADDPSQEQIRLAVLAALIGESHG